jgi:hypothetical protein
MLLGTDGALLMTRAQDQDNVEGAEASLMATAFDPFRTFGPVHELEIPRVPFF